MTSPRDLPSVFPEDPLDSEMADLNAAIAGFLRGPFPLSEPSHYLAQVKKHITEATTETSGNRTFNILTTARTDALLGAFACALHNRNTSLEAELQYLLHRIRVQAELFVSAPPDAQQYEIQRLISLDDGSAEPDEDVFTNLAARCIAWNISLML
jgi:hypothetical protein